MANSLNDKIKSNKGFTLVEVIVVLVILAILMAITIPSILGYISKAKSTACDAYIHSLYSDILLTIKPNEPLTQEKAEQVLADYGAVCPGGGNITVTVDENGLSISCDKHSKTSQNDENEILSIPDTVLKNFQAITSTVANNDDARAKYFETHESFPTFTYNDTTYQIEPYIAKSGESWILAREGDGTTFKNNWSVPFVYDPSVKKWYYHRHNYQSLNSAKVNYDSLADLQTAIASEPNGIGDRWVECTSDIAYN